MDSVTDTAKRTQPMSESKMPTVDELAPIAAAMTQPRWRVPEQKLADATAMIVWGHIRHHETRADAYLAQPTPPDTEPYVTTKSGCTCREAKKQSHCVHVTAVEILSRWEGDAHANRVTKEGAHVDAGIEPGPVEEALSASPRASRPAEETPPLEPIEWTVIPATHEDTAVLPAMVPVEGEVEVLERSLTTWSAKRRVLTQFMVEHMTKGIDYGGVHFAKDCNAKNRCTDSYHFSKDSLFKSGSEKFLGLLQLQATFRKDEETWEMLGRPPGVLCYVCTLVTRTGEVVGEGRGACDSKKPGTDINKAIKMAEKSAQIDALLRAGSLSDCFTQDLEDHEDSKPPVAEKLPPAQARKRISDFLRERGHKGTDKAACEQSISELTALALTPEHFGEIVRRLDYAKEG